jgi:hypothetical protein
MLLVNVHISYFFIQEHLVKVNIINFRVQKVKLWEKPHSKTHMETFHL